MTDTGPLLRLGSREQALDEEEHRKSQHQALKWKAIFLLVAVVGTATWAVKTAGPAASRQADGSSSSSSLQQPAPNQLRAAASDSKPQSPNFVLIMADDQSDLLGDSGADVMPQLHELLISQGQRFLNYFTTTPICCPSRVSVWRAQHAHNHNFTDLMGKDEEGHGGWDKFKELGVDESYLPTWLQQLGYNTYYTGKFIVDYTVNNYANYPKGWTDIDALVLPYLFQYYEPVFSRNGQPPKQYVGQYSTDVIADKARAQIRTAASEGKPFFIQVAPIAPHATLGGPTSPGRNDSLLDTTVLYPPLPAPRHWHLFSDYELPEPLLSFNEEDVSDKPLWIRNLHRLSKGNITLLQETYRARLRALRGVDELIGSVVDQLRELNLLDNTYILYTADNGYHLGTHRRGSGKESAYEEDIRIPFVIRGPGVAKGVTSLEQAAHVDIAPTILALAGANAPPELDGYPLPLAEDEGNAVRLPESYPKTRDTHYRSLLPFSYFAGVVGDSEEQLAGPDRPRNTNWTWRSLRVLDHHSTAHADKEPHRLYPLQRGYKYTIICSNERELYDLRDDPNEVNNLLQQNAAEDNGLHRLHKRLDVLFQVQQACWGDSCRRPFQIIHKDNTTQVKDLWAALDPKYDHLYDKVPAFRWKTCERYQDLSQEENAFRDIIGVFPRGPDGVTLARINITRYNTDDPAEAMTDAAVDAASAATITEPPRRMLTTGAGPQQQQAAQTFLADVEKYAVPLNLPQELTNRQVYGPKGLGHFYA